MDEYNETNNNRLNESPRVKCKMYVCRRADMRSTRMWRCRRSAGRRAGPSSDTPLCTASCMSLLLRSCWAHSAPIRTAAAERPAPPSGPRTLQHIYSSFLGWCCIARIFESELTMLLARKLRDACRKASFKESNLHVINCYRNGNLIKINNDSSGM